MPVVAGRFYEGKADLLTERIQNCFLTGLGPGRIPEGDPGTTREVKAVISPHAGYMYSGMPAAHSFLRLYEDGKPDHIVIIGPNHYGIGARVAICNDNWETPLGVVRYDAELGSAIVEENEHASNDCVAHSSEHSIEVQLPFESVGKTIAALAEEMDILVIASSDFTHFETAESAKKKDNQAMEYLEFLDPQGFIDFVRSHRISICGAGPIATAMVYAKERGATRFEVLKYTNSGDMTGNYNDVVAYVSAEIV